jgi:hypothetical protein
MANPCKYTLKDGTVLDFTQARQYVMDNIAELTKESPTLKSKYDAATKGKVEGDNKQEYKEGDKGRERPKAGSRNRAKSSKAIPEEIRTPDVVAVFNMLGEALAQEAAEVVAPIVQEEAKPMTNAEKGKLFAEKLRAAKLKNRGETYSSLPFLEQAVDTALEAAALVAENGGKFIDIINAAIESLRANSDYAVLTDSQKENIEKDLTEEMARYSDEVEESQRGSGKLKVSKTAKDFAAGLREQQRNDLADIVEAGKNYEVRNQKKVMADAIALMDADRTGNIAYKLAKNGDLHPDITNAIFAQRLIDAMAAYSARQDASTTEAFELANKEYQNYGTYIAQGLSMRNYLAQMIPFMMVDRVKNKATNDVKDELGFDGEQKTKEVAVEAKKTRTEVFTDIANLVTGQDIDPNTILSKYSNPRIKKALDVLVSFGVHLNKNGAKGSGLTQLLKLVAQDGQVAVDATREQVRDLVTVNLRAINQGLKENEMSEAQVNKAIDAFMETYEEIASWQMKRALDRAFGDNSKTPSISGSKNPTIVKQILFGALEGDRYIDKFAVKYGLPILTPENIAKLTELAENVAAARTKGAFALANANNAFNNYINTLKAKASGGIIGRNIKAFNYIAAYQFNNLLLRASILNKAIISNVFQTFPKMVMQMMREMDITLGGTFNTLKTSVIDPVTNQPVALNVSPTKDNMTFGSIGINKEGRSDIETDILNQKSKIKRALSKVFLVGSSRAFAVVDALTIPLATSITSRQAYGALLKELYKKNKIDKSRREIYQDVTALLGRDETTVTAAFSKAMQEMRNSQLWKDAGFDSTTPFPQDPGIMKVGTKEARIYNETKIRMYELLSEGVMERLVQLNQNLNPALSTNDALKISEEYQKEINRYISANTREISFLGRPQGTPGQLADVLNYISSGKMSPLKHSTLMPLFNNAVANGFSLYIKYDPLLSTLRSIKYKRTGKRGLTPKEQNMSYKLDFMLKMDQARLRESMFAGYAITAGLVAMLMKFRGDDDDDDKRIEKAAKGKGTFIATKEMEGRGLLDASGDPIKGGYIYIDGVQQYNWMISPFYGAISAAAVLDNYRVFETSRAVDGIRKPFIEDDEGLNSAIGMYMMNTLSGVMNYSSMSQQYKTLSDLMQLTQESNKGGWERTGESLKNVFANMIQSFVPLSGLQKDAQNAYDAYNGNPNKLATDVFEKMAINLAFTDGALRSNKTDCFGRPVEEELKAVGPFMGVDMFQFDKGKLSLPFNRAYEDDKYMQMHTMHNFYPMVGNSTTIPITYAIEEGKDFASDLSYSTSTGKANGEMITAEDIYDVEKQAASSKRVKDKPKVKEIAPGVPESISYNLELTAEENNDANELMGKIVKNMFDEPGNMDTMYDMFANNEHYKNCMTSLYTIAKRVAIIEMIDEIKDQELYIKATKNLINTWKNTYPDLTLPEKIEDISNY